MPLLYLLWSHFPTKTGGITGVALTAFGISAFSSCIIATFVVNPDNSVASIPYVEGVQVKIQQIIINKHKKLLKMDFH